MSRGFVDIQNNGWMGTDFSEPNLTADRVKQITRELVERGTIGYCPTVVTTTEANYRSSLKAIAQAKRDPELGGHILGVHVEGPFISPEPGARGAHPQDCIRDPDPAFLDKLLEWGEGLIRILTVAPERPGCEALIRHAVKRGVVVSMGHHLATDADLDRAVQAGASLLTHVGNGIPNMINRHQNPLWWSLATDAVTGMFITDGHHLPADLIAVALRAKGVSRFVVTSDASPLAGMPPGRYTIFGKMAVVIDNTGLIYAEEAKSLAGSHSTMMECMNHLASLKILAERDLWAVGLENPLRMIGMKAADIAGLKGPTVKFADGKFAV